jgi:hypothetical protein
MAGRAIAGHAVVLSFYRPNSTQRLPATLQLAQLQGYAVSMSEEIKRGHILTIRAAPCSRGAVPDAFDRPAEH